MSGTLSNRNKSTRKSTCKGIYCNVVHKAKKLEKRCAHKVEWVEKLWHSHTMDYYVAIKRQ